MNEPELEYLLMKIGLTNSDANDIAWGHIHMKHPSNRDSKMLTDNEKITLLKECKLDDDDISDIIKGVLSNIRGTKILESITEGPIKNVPDAVIKSVIMIFLNDESLAMMLAVSKRYNRLVKSPEVWKDRPFKSQNGDIYFKQHVGYRKLKIVDLSNSSITDQTLFKMPRSVTKLNLSNVKHITTNGIGHLGLLSRLQELDLSKTNIGDNAVKSLSYLKNLKRLNLSDTKITDYCKKDLSKITSLEYLNLSNTKITDYKKGNLS
jgi:Leucine-rich repeat (LRR) protein